MEAGTGSYSAVQEEVGAHPAAFPEPQSIQETGLSLSFLSDLVLKVAYFEGVLSGRRISQEVRLPFQGVLINVMEFLRREQFVEIKGSDGMGEASYQYTITQKGSERAHQVLDRSQYVGPAPVTLDMYRRAVRLQSLEKLSVDRDTLRKSLRHLVLGEDFLDLMGPAVNSGRSIFLYGPPGNGKTVIAECIPDMLGGAILIPHAVEVDGTVIKVFDPLSHERLPSPDDGKNAKVRSGRDKRWVLAKRPVVIVGGELTLASLDLVYNDVAKFYEAPYQMKANGGMFLVDDFGRQLVRPKDLLNRWIVPLEKRLDYLTLHTGKKIEVPFDTLIIFATNLLPTELVDEAFLRRIRHKIEVADPTFDQYREIFRRVCRAKRIAYEESVLAYLLNEHYLKNGRPLRSCHPRDIIEELMDIARYLGRPPRLTEDFIDRACAAYFVDL